MGREAGKLNDYTNQIWCQQNFDIVEKPFWVQIDFYYFFGHGTEVPTEFK